jgi:hypothetical protein
MSTKSVAPTTATRQETPLSLAGVEIVRMAPGGTQPEGPR